MRADQWLTLALGMVAAGVVLVAIGYHVAGSQIVGVAGISSTVLGSFGPLVAAFYGREEA